ncbi:unnamed protein product, partial [Callosobruchus maculatus]
TTETETEVHRIGRRTPKRQQSVGVLVSCDQQRRQASRRQHSPGNYTVHRALFCLFFYRLDKEAGYSNLRSVFHFEQ